MGRAETVRSFWRFRKLGSKDSGIRLIVYSEGLRVSSLGFGV